MVRIEYDDFVRTGPGTIAGRYLRSFWQPVYQARDLGQARARPIRVMGVDLTLYRGEDSTPHLIDHRCPHRGLQLSVGRIEGDAIRCFYHGWKFGADGRCLEQPAERPPFCDKIRVRSYPVREYLGLIFAYLGEGAPPPLPRYPDFEDFEGVLEQECYRRACSYFQNLENSIDHVHVGFVHHGQAGSFDGVRDSPRIRAEESPWGITCHIERPSGRKGMSQFGMPNVFHLQGLPNDPEIAGHREFLAWWVPIDDTSHVQFGVYAVRVSAEKARLYLARQSARAGARTMPHAALAERILAGEIDLADVDRATTDMVRLVDDISQIGQGRIVDRNNDCTGQSDAGVVLIRKLWARELAAFRDGAPLTPWRYDGATLQVAKS